MSLLNGHSTDNGSGQTDEPSDTMTPLTQVTPV
jgi:hypothetical protein